MPPSVKKKRRFQFPVDKFNARREELAEAALQTFMELGYANTSLREIAENSRFSHGVMHYYFSDKTDLITCCVKIYKKTCVARFDSLLIEAVDHRQFMKKFLDNLAATLTDGALVHRLWYDLRLQALFEDSFRADVQEIDANLEGMIWRIVQRAGELAGKAPGQSSAFYYATFDGLFQKALLAHIAGDRNAASSLQRQVRQLLQS